MPEIQPTAQPAANDAGVNALLGQLVQNMAVAGSDRARAAARRDKLLGELGQIKTPETPRLMAAPTEAPKSPEPDPFRAFTGFAPLLAAIGSFFTRKPLIAALNSLGAAGQAFAQGQHEAYQQQVESFNAQAKAALINNKALLDQYKIIVDNRNLTANEKIAEIQAAASESRDDSMLEQNSLRAMISLIDTRSNSANRLKEALIGASSRLEAAEITARGKTKSTSQLEGQAVQEKFAEAEKQKGAPLTADEKLKIISKSKIPEQALFDKPTAHFFAVQYLGGNQVGFQAFGFGAAGQANRNMVAKEIVQTAKEMNLTPLQVNAAMARFKADTQGLVQTVKQGAQTQRFAIEADKQGQLVIDAFDSLDPSEIPLINRFRNIFLTQSGDPKVVRAAAAVNSFANTYGKTIQGGIGVPTDTAREHVYDVLSLALNKQQIEAGVNQLRKEMQAAVQSPEDTADILKLRIEGKKADFNLPSLTQNNTPKLGSQQNPVALSDDPEKDQKFQLAPSGTFFLTTDGKLIRKR